MERGGVHRLSQRNSAFVTDNQGIVRWTSPLFRLGVNPWGLSGQTVVSINAWNFNVPETIADSVFGFGIAIGDSPDNLQQIMNNSVGALLNTLTPLVSAIGGTPGKQENRFIHSGFRDHNLGLREHNLTSGLERGVADAVERRAVV